MCAALEPARGTPSRLLRRQGPQTSHIFVCSDYQV